MSTSAPHAHSHIEDSLTAKVRAFQSDMVACCSRLIQTPSVNGVHDESVLAGVLADQARALGLHVEMAALDPRRPNLIVSTAASGPVGLLLLGHLDTVPPGDEARWTHPPFSGAVVGDRIFGRGAVDTKGGMTAALYALAALQRTPGALASGRAMLICVPDEESGATGTLGIRYLHDLGRLSALGAIYAYSGDLITLGHRGLARFRLICHGQSIHTGSDEWQNGLAGANAVTGMADLLLELEGLTFPPSASAYFEPYRLVITPGTVISGGVSINVVPDRCEALVDSRLTPEWDLSRVESLLDEAAARVLERRPRLRFEREALNYAPAAITDESAAIVSALEDSVRRVKGIEPQRVVAGPANEGYLLIERGIPTICGFGPPGANAHAVDEYVEIPGLVDAALIFALTAHRLSVQLSPP